MQSTPPAKPASPPAPLSATAGHVLALLVLAASLLLVYLYWRSANDREMDAAQAAFTARADDAAARLVRRLGNHELIARGGVSLSASVARPSRRQWQNYVEGLNLRERYPDLTGLGFLVYSTSLQLSELQRLLRESGEGMFSAWPHGIRAHYGPLLYLEPKTRENMAAIGYDMYADPVLRTAMDAARDSGRPVMSAPVRLVQDVDRGAAVPGLVLFLPVYRFGDRPETTEARRLSLQGWVETSFRMADFVEATLRGMPDRVRLRVVDVTDGGHAVLYADPAREGDGAPAFHATSDLDAYGRQWRLEFASAPRAELAAGMSGLRNTLAIGVIASLLLFGIVLALARTQVRAERLAARMTESFSRSELRFRNALEYSSMGTALLDQHGRIADANPALERVLRKSRAQLIGSAFDAHFIDHGNDDPVRGDVYRSTRSMLADDGSLRQLQLTHAPMPGDVDSDIVRQVQVEDVTDRLRAEAQVLSLNRTLEARVVARTRELTIANQDLESFAYSVSHDLRAPLRAIEGFSRLLDERQGGALDAEGRDYLARVRNAATRMGSLIESLLKMARLGRSGIKPVPLDLSRMAADIVAELRAGEPGRDVNVTIEPGLVATGDASLVRNLMGNLLGNAWKFTGGRQGATIEFGRDASGAFFVRDNGAGFPVEYGDKLFRPFQRLHSQDQFAGDGVGLASVRRIVERHGGTIRADGALEKGATFAFTLPGKPEV
ncbi:MAG: CHASE domain-containing protein [Pseudomonadota bacterium]|nr:CHASE domain-containing protein [Pseudomonadota bacterium]